MGIDKHEASRRGRNKPSGAARRAKKGRERIEARAAKRVAIIVPPGTPGFPNATPPLARGWDAPAVVPDARPPAAADGTVLAVPAGTTKHAAKLARSDSTDVRLPNSWFGEMEQLTGEPTTSAKPAQIRALIVLARGLLRKG